MRFADRGALCAAALSVALALTAAGPAAGQGALTGECRQRAAGATEATCLLAVQAVDILPARVGMVAAGGNPVPGTASTFGIRLGSFPRFSANVRTSFIPVDLPTIAETSGGAEFIAPGVNADVSVGLFSGLSPFATVGGLGSIDLIGSFGLVWLSGDDGSNGDVPITWAAGARIGITRESFTMPGISLSAMYRQLGEMTYGDNRLTRQHAFVHVDDVSLWSVRAAVGKRITLLGFTAGAGWDRYTGDALVRIRTGPGSMLDLRDEGFSGSRWNVFANAAWTLLIISATAELGWQFGGDAPADAASDPASTGAPFASFAIRLAL